MSTPRLLPFRIATLLCCVAGVSSVQAHSDLPTAVWCENGREVELATFQIQPTTLQQLRADDECPPPGSPILKDCGQFDDDYGVAKSAAGAACAAYMPLKAPVGDIGSVVILIHQPQQYLVESHHSAYNVGLGLSGSCVRCDARDRVVPVRPLLPALGQ